MRKLILSICLFIVAIAASAQLTPSAGGIPYTQITGIDYVFIFNGLDNASINYNGSGKDVKWYKFSDQITPFFTGVNLFDNLTDGTGYIFEDAEGKRKTFWVIDYGLHKPEFTAIELNNNTTDQCKNVNLNIVATASELKYQTQNGVSYTIPRKFKITYNTLKWESDRWSTVSVDTTLTLSATANTQLLLPAPFCNTTYTLSGDQYANDLGLVIKKVSDEYTPVAVICHETSILATRDATNEAERPTQAKQISGSAPLDMQFLSNANIPITQYYKWEIFKDKTIQPFISRTDKDIRYTFSEAGIYKVRVAVSNATACSFSDSIIVTVSESQIKAPNVFTPNGDGMNDEFRVAYKSIISFHCWVYNRWGRLVYEWTDPQKGWDGKIGGKDATPGPYYYVINAKGSDARKYKLKGDINLLRGTGN